MKKSQEYLSLLAQSLGHLDQEQLDKAAQVLAEAQQADKLIHVFGTEYPTAALVSELFFRPGGLTNIDPILDPSLDPAHGAYRNAMCMELDGLAPCILDYYEYVQAGDPILLMGSDPEALMFRQALEWAKKKGLITIALICQGTDCDADVVLHHGGMKDSLVEVKGIPLGGEQTMALTVLINMLVIETVAKLEEPERHVWKGRHVADIASNQQRIDEMLFRVRHL